MFEGNKLVPELMVTNLARSLNFRVSCLGFKWRMNDWKIGSPTSI
jgi:hypothetical protein